MSQMPKYPCDPEKAVSRVRWFILPVLVMGSCSTAAAQAPMVPENQTAKIAENVYVIPDRRVNLVPNIGIIVGDKGILVVDTGMGPRNAETVLREVRRISNKKILFLTMTHFHPEHGMGAQAFPEGTTIVVPKAQKAELLEKGSAYIKMFSGFSSGIADLLENVKLVSPQLAFEREVEIDLGGKLVRLLYFGPAHTRGDNFIFLPQERILFGGDVVLNRFFPIMPDADSSGTGWIRTLKKLEALAPAKVIPGHGEVGDINLIRGMKDFLVSLKSRVGQLKAAGKNLQEIEGIAIPEFHEKYKKWDNPEWLKNAVDKFHSELTTP